MPAATFDVSITDLDHEGRGVGRRENRKAIFVEGALPGEVVRVTLKKDKPSFSIGKLVKVVKVSSQRVTPPCPHFEMCGGCTLQHLHPDGQVAVKQRALEATLARIGHVFPDQLLTPIYGPAWGYRTRARLSVWHVDNEMLVGFRRRHSSYVEGLKECHILPKQVSDLLQPLALLLQQLSIKAHIPQIEVAMPTVPDADRVILVLRILDSLNKADLQALQNFAHQHPVQWWLQPEGPDSATPYYPSESRLAYELPDFGLEYDFYPTEFTQVNAGVNQVMVRRAVQLLNPHEGESIVDFFCGLGNFTLPIARQGAQVLGLEGSPALVKRARENAQKLGLVDRTRFDCLNLFDVTTEQLAQWGTPDGALIDPPRDGAIQLVKALPEKGYERIVYISCNPATLARDAAVLVHKKGYQMEAAGVMNMFPHTTHTESIAVFRRR